MPITVDINTIQPYTLANTPILVIPFAILYVQAYLLLKYGPTSRLARLALIPFSLSSIKNAWLDHRVTDERYVIWNFVLGCAAVFVSTSFHSPSTAHPFRAKSTPSSPSSTRPSDTDRNASTLPDQHTMPFTSSPRHDSSAGPAACPSRSTRTHRTSHERTFPHLARGNASPSGK